MGSQELFDRAKTCIPGSSGVPQGRTSDTLTAAHTEADLPRTLDAVREFVK